MNPEKQTPITDIDTHNQAAAFEEHLLDRPSALEVGEPRPAMANGGVNLTEKVRPHIESPGANVSSAVSKFENYGIHDTSAPIETAKSRKIPVRLLGGVAALAIAVNVVVGAGDKHDDGSRATDAKAKQTLNSNFSYTSDGKVLPKH